MNYCVVLFAISLALALLAVLLEAAENKRLQRELGAERAKNSQRWDWTKEGEKRAGQVMEMICDKCHEPFRGWSQDELDVACARCKLPEAVHRLAEGPGKTPPPAAKPPQSQRLRETRCDSSPGGGAKGKEARG